MASSSAQVRAYAGPALFSYGFRPFFLFGAAWAALAVALWLPLLSGHLSLPTAFSPVQWHVHELVFGYVPAIVAGFLLTAVPNWTGRLPVIGWPLAGLFAVWLLGRLAVATSALIGAKAAAIVDVAFLVLLGGVVAREILASSNKRNLKVLGAVVLLAVGNLAFHAEALHGSLEGRAQRLGIAATVLLIMIIGGRIIPSFTHNWLLRQAPGRMPAKLDRNDIASMVVSGLALCAWVVAPQSAASAVLALAAGAANTARLSRWAGERTFAEPLVAILHVAYAFIPIGFVLLALGILVPTVIAPSGALHGWTAGAIGLMTLAIMTRASLGHTGQPLTATTGIVVIYVAAVVAALARVVAAAGLLRDVLLAVSAAAWVVAFAVFIAVYAPLLARKRA